MCVCVRACVRACMHACVRVCVRVCVCVSVSVQCVVSTLAIVVYSQFQVAYPIVEKHKTKLSNQICRTW